MKVCKTEAKRKYKQKSEKMHTEIYRNKGAQCKFNITNRAR